MIQTDPFRDLAALQKVSRRQQNNGGVRRRSLRRGSDGGSHRPSRVKSESRHHRRRNVITIAAERNCSATRPQPYFGERYRGASDADPRRRLDLKTSKRTCTRRAHDPNPSRTASSQVEGYRADPRRKHRRLPCRS